MGRQSYGRLDVRVGAVTPKMGDRLAPMQIRDSAPVPLVTLLTRPATQVEPLLGTLQRAGYHPRNEPMLDIVDEPGSMSDLVSAGALCVTSLNGADCLSRKDWLRRGLPTLAVGPATAERLRSAGFTNVRHANGTGLDLAKLAHETLPRRLGPIVHASGEDIALDVAAYLRARGRIASRVVLYRAISVTELSNDIRSSFQKERIGAIVCLSRRTAKHLRHALARVDLLDKGTHVPAFVLSKNIAETLTSSGWSRVYVADHPSLASIFSTLQSYADQLNLRL